MNEPNNPEPKISGPEGALMIGLAFVFDIADFLATFLDEFFGLGEIIKFFINVIAFVIFWLWAMIKGVRVERAIVGSILEFIPFLNILPARTTAIASTVWLDWHPKEAALIGNVVPNIKNKRRAIGAKARALKNQKENPSA